MNVFKALELMSKYSDCPNCGNTAVSNGEGKLIVEDDAFTRECKCGFKITFNEDRKKIEPKKIRGKENRTKNE